jgi:RNA polymerase sigma factor (sigma-70 family)
MGEQPVGAATAVADPAGMVTGLFAREAAALVRLARCHVDDEAAAEDVVQEAFIRLTRSAHRIRDEDRAGAYLRAIVRNMARDDNRRRLAWARRHAPADPTPADVEEVVTGRDDQRRLVAALRQLPRRQRDCVVLRYYQELGVPEIATALALSVNSVKTHLQRGLRALEGEMQAGCRW